jgi:hypothetical protein
MAKLCPRGKAAAKRKFKVYPSAYANMYASAVCSGKVTPGGKKRINHNEFRKARSNSKQGGIATGCGKRNVQIEERVTKIYLAWLKMV